MLGNQRLDKVVRFLASPGEEDGDAAKLLLGLDAARNGRGVEDDGELVGLLAEAARQHAEQIVTRLFKSVRPYLALENAHGMKEIVAVDDIGEQRTSER